MSSVVGIDAKKVASNKPRIFSTLAFILENYAVINLALMYEKYKQSSLIYFDKI